MANYGELKMAIMERCEARRTFISCSTPTNSPIALLLKYYLTLLLEKKPIFKKRPIMTNYGQLRERGGSNKLHFVLYPH